MLSRPRTRTASGTTGRRTRRLAAAALLSLALAGTGLAATTGAAGAAKDNNVVTPVPMAPATQFRIASFNLLGAGHTDPKDADRRSFAKSTVRMGYSVQLMKEQNLSVVGFQEFQSPQFQEFRRLTGDAYGIYPGDTFGANSAPMHNSIVWRKTDWTLLQADTLAIPYGFKTVNGKKVVSYIQMPVLLLQSVATGQQVWVSNFHNAAKVMGPQSHRDQAKALEIALVKRLRVANPTIPVFVLGDMNETDNYFCPVVRSGLQAAGPGGVTSANKCIAPRPIGVDWIFGTKDVTFSGHARLRTPLVQKATDHPLVVSDVSVPPARLQQSAVRRVVAISVDGLRAGIVKKLGADLRGLNTMISQGASTLRAHTIADSTAGLSNQASILTGRPLWTSSGGHGLKGEKAKSTVHATAGRYVSSIFDIVRNNDRSTAAYTDSSAVASLLTSWNEKNGGSDGQGLDSGRNKFNARVHEARPGKLVKAAKSKLRTSPAALTYVHLSEPDRVGHQSKFAGKAYREAVIRTDVQVRRLLSVIRSTPALNGSTLVVLTSSNGGTGKSHTDRTKRANHTVPFAIWGPGLDIPAGADLFALNPQLVSSADQLSHSTDTIRNASLANVVLSALRLPSVPGSSFGGRQTLTWTAATPTP